MPTESTDARCPACDDQFEDYDQLVDHLTDSHDAYSLVTA